MRQFNTAEEDIFQTHSNNVRDGLSGKQLVVSTTGYLLVSYTSLVVNHIDILLKENPVVDMMIIRAGRGSIFKDSLKSRTEVFAQGKSCVIKWDEPS